ncbi:ribonuclease P protein component [Candidatus Phytoplasma solani]|uniref:ribonuclease P protein component n=1 Tax=Candidatus Phytoplasma solani TaxID=69896 RepID=UPI0032DAD15D
MKRKYILKKESEVTAVFRSKKRYGNSSFMIYYLQQNTNPHFKFALSVGKKYGKAHQRNLIKRRLRSIISNYACNLNSTIFFVIVIKPQAKNLTFQQLKYLFVKCAFKIHLLLSNN